MSKYIIFENKKGESLVYYPCAKNANSSAKLFFIKQLGKENRMLLHKNRRIDPVLPLSTPNILN